jgi:hypothetical protein
VEHILPPAFHGNPVSADGSLVFTDYCWDLLDIMKESGFADVTVDVYASPELGHLGGGQLVFRALKGGHSANACALDIHLELGATISNPSKLAKASHSPTNQKRKFIL